MFYTRYLKSLLVFSVALYFALVVFGNLTDYQSNFAFVGHVLSMDTTIPGNNGMWRAIQGTFWHHLFFASIILWEVSVCLLCFIGSKKLFVSTKKDEAFMAAKDFTNIGLVLGLLLWFLAFMTVGGEWFFMWQSSEWNGLSAALRMFTVLGIILIFLNQKD